RVFGTAPDGRHVIAKFVSELDAQVTQAADALHGDEIAGQRTAVAKSVVGGNSGVEQGRGFDVTEAIRDRHQSFHWGQHVFLISAVIADAGDLHAPAIAKISAPAFAAGIVVAAVPADAHTLTFLPGRNSSAHFINHARHFVSGNARILNSRPQAFFDEHVAVADATGLYLNAHLPRIGLRDRTLDDLEIRSRFGNLRHLHGR